MTTLRIALEWYLNPDHLPLLAAREALVGDGIAVELIAPDDHYDGFDALARGEVDLVVNEPLHLVERREGRLRSLGCFFATDGGVLMTRVGIAKLRAGEPVRIASPVSNPTTDGLCRDILAGWSGRPADGVTIEEAGFGHVDNLAAGYDGAWLAFANVEGVDAQQRGLDAALVTTRDGGVPGFSALELIARADDDPARMRSLVDAIDAAVPALRADPAAARALWYRASGETPNPTSDAIVADTLGRLVAPVRPDAERWRPIWRHLSARGADVIDAAAFDAIFA